MASSGGHADIVRLLLERGANTEAQTKVSERGSIVYVVNADIMLTLLMSESSKILLYVFMIYLFISNDIMYMFALNIYI